jgi:sugar (pentulose or hexulose) kinase
MPASSNWPGAGGLTLLPFFNGDRTPNLTDARGATRGMDLFSATTANFYRAAMEGATYTLKYGYDAFAAAGLDFGSIVLTGGGCRSAAWRRLIADVFDVPVELSRQAEGAAFGAPAHRAWAGNESAPTRQSPTDGDPLDTQCSSALSPAASIARDRLYSPISILE